MARYGRSFPAPAVIVKRARVIDSVSYITTENAGAGSTSITLADEDNLAGDLVCCFAFTLTGVTRTWQSPITSDAASNNGTIGWGLGHGILSTPTDTVSVNAGSTRLEAVVLRFANATLDDFDVNNGTGESATVSDALALTDPGGMVISMVFLNAASVTVSDPANLPVNFRSGLNTATVRGNRTADGGHGLTGNFTPDPFTWTGSRTWVRMTVATKTA